MATVSPNRLEGEIDAPFLSSVRDSRIVLDSRFSARDPLPSEEKPSFRDTPEWLLATRVAASKAFAKSELMRGFLLYVCEQHLLGNAQEITEHRIGRKVFNRPADYNPGEDNIVRNYARILRKRLEQYFQREGLSEPIKLSIPRGSYIPVFERIADAESRSVTKPNRAAESDIPTSSDRGIHHGVTAEKESATASANRWLWMALGVVAGALLSSCVWLYITYSKKIEVPRSAAHAIWSQLFQDNRNTIIVSADSGLGILENLTKRSVALEDYANGSYLTDLKPSAGLDIGNLNDLRRQRYTSFADLNIASELTQLPEFIANRTLVRYARSITLEDLRGSNAILIGSNHTNPWVSLFDKNLNFKLQYTPEVDRSYVLNVSPQATEQKIYENGRDAEANQTYGAIDYLPSLDGTGHVLIVQGLNMAATQAAADILFDPKAMQSVLARAALPDGSLRSFELLITTRSIDANAPGARIVATRFSPTQ